jgi:hypothetical protein
VQSHSGCTRTQSIAGANQVVKGGRGVIVERGVNTKIWYRKGTNLWAEFGKEAPFDRRFSSKNSVKILAVGSTPSFGRRAVCA